MKNTILRVLIQYEAREQNKMLAKISVPDNIEWKRVFEVAHSFC